MDEMCGVHDDTANCPTESVYRPLIDLAAHFKRIFNRNKKISLKNVGGLRGVVRG